MSDRSDSSSASDTGSGAPGPNGKGQGNGSAPPPGYTTLPINVLGQYVKDFSFENPNAPRSLMPGQNAPQVEVSVNVDTQTIGENMFEVALNVRCEARMGEMVAFLVDLTYAGLLTLQGIPQEHVRAVLLIEGPRLLFPFARAIISDASREGGYPPLLLNPIDFADLYRRQLAREAEEAGGPVAGQA